MWIEQHRPNRNGQIRKQSVLNCGLAQISWAYGQGAKSPTRAVAALLARLKNYYIPHPYGLDSLWLGFSVAWVHCGLVPLNLFNYIHVKYYFAEFYTCSVIRLFTYLFGECTFCSLKIDQLLFVQILNSSIIKLVS